MRLTVITAHYPTAFEFIEDELPFLSCAFSNLELVPLVDMREDGRGRHPLPPGVTVDYSLARSISPPSRFGPIGGKGWATLRANLLAYRHGFHRSRGESPPGDSVIRWWRAVLLQQRLIELGGQWARSRVEQPDIVYSYWLNPMAIGVRSAWRQVPLVARAHGGDIYPEQTGLQALPFFDATLKAHSRIFCVSSNGCDYLAAASHDDLSRLELQRLASRDVGRLNPGGAQESDVIRLLSVSRVDKNKRVDLIGRVAIACSEMGRPIEWTHIGDGPELARVQNLAAQRQSARFKATFLGSQGHDIVLETLANTPIDVMINLSLSEGVPVSLMEAQCAGIPCLGTAVGGVEDVLAGAGNMLLSPLSSVNDLAAAVLLLAKSPVPRLQRRLAWKAKFDLEQNYTVFAERLQAIAKEGLVSPSRAE